MKIRESQGRDDTLRASLKKAKVASAEQLKSVESDAGSRDHSDEVHRLMKELNISASQAKMKQSSKVIMRAND